MRTRPSPPPPRRSPGGRTGRRQRDYWHGRLSSSSHTRRLGSQIGQSLRGGEVLALFGELGTGKTTLIRGVAEGLGIPARAVSSPTFVLVHEYQGRKPLAHADLYRLESEHELVYVGLSDYLDGRWVVGIEWADKCQFLLPSDRLDVHLTHRSPSSREVLLKATGPGAVDLLTRILKRRRARRTPATVKRRQRRP